MKRFLVLTVLIGLGLNASAADTKKKIQRKPDQAALNMVNLSKEDIHKLMRAIEHATYTRSRRGQSSMAIISCNEREQYCTIAPSVNNVSVAGCYPDQNHAEFPDYSSYPGYGSCPAYGSYPGYGSYGSYPYYGSY